MEVRIVVVDDDRANVELIRRMLERAGYDGVVVTDEPERGIGLCLEQPTGLLLVDLHMRGTDGYDVMAAVHERDPGLPVILVTGDAAGGVKERAIQAGASDVLVKPFDYDQLLAGVAARLREPR